MPLSYEGKVLTVFAEEGIKVPPIYGFIDTLPALVMGQLPGRPQYRHSRERRRSPSAS